ncbi:MAG: EF-Tu/IF-2/RF-3 family GTPase, partial [archaeon]
MAQKNGVKFQDIVDAYLNNTPDQLREKSPLNEAILNMAVDAMPPPHVAQKYRIPKIWKGNLDSPIAKSMMECDDNGPIVMAVTNIVVDPQAGVVATGRLFSGTIREGDTIHLIDSKVDSRVQQVCIYMGPA